MRKLIVAVNDESKGALKKFESHILEELNIKRLELADSLDEYVSYEIKPNGKTIGPRFGEDIKIITELLANKSAGEIAKKTADGKTIVLKSDEKQWELTPEDIFVTQNLAENFAANDSAEPALVLDTEITDELLREGLARDIVRHIQQLRKEVGLQIQDHIELCFESDNEVVQAAMEEHKTYICQETLCQQIRDSKIAEDSDSKEVKIGGAQVKLQVTKVG